MTGWIKLHRQFRSWEWYEDHNTTRLFLHLLMSANYEPSRYLGHIIPAGGIVIGRKALAKQTGLSEQNIRTCLTKLKSTNEITIKVTNKFSIAHIVKWDEFQSDQPANQPANQPTTNQQADWRWHCRNLRSWRYHPYPVSDSHDRESHPQWL